MLPELLARERAAAISQMFEELERGSQGFGTASTEIRTTLDAGAAAADALQETLAALDRLAARYAELKPAQTAEPARPFDVREYTSLLRESQASARELNALAQRLETVLPEAAGAVRSAAESLARVLDRVFFQLLALLIVGCVSVLMTALAYRAITNGISRQERKHAKDLR
jgi:hypothetical protein